MLKYASVAAIKYIEANGMPADQAAFDKECGVGVL